MTAFEILTLIGCTAPLVFLLVVAYHVVMDDVDSVTQSFIEYMK